VRDLSPFDFGLIVAYLVPGFVVLWGLSLHFPIVAGWLAVAPQSAPTIGDLLYTTLASVACGMTVNAVRWAIIDTIHHHTGIPPPACDYSLLPERLAAFQSVVEDHYRFFQHYANMLVALGFTYVAQRTALGPRAAGWGMLDIGFVVIGVFLFLGSCDSLRKYYRKAGELLKPR